MYRDEFAGTGVAEAMPVFFYCAETGLLFVLLIGEIVNSVYK